jgi:pilus assembly protein CpaC
MAFLKLLLKRTQTSFFLKILLVGVFISLEGAFSKIDPEGGQPLQLIVNTAQMLSLDEIASEVFIADPTIADVQISTPKRVYVFGKSPGSTNLFVTNGEGKVIENRTLNVVHNTAPLQKILDKLLGSNAVRLHSLPEGIILEGRVPSSDRVDEIFRISEGYLGKKIKLINNLQVTTPAQVNLRVKIVEVDRQATNNLGINWDMAFKNSHPYGSAFAGGLFTGTSLLNTTTGTALRPFALSGLGDANSAQFLPFRFSRNSQFDLSGLITALESEGLATVLAEPNLTTLSGETASFLSGGELGIPMSGGVGAPPTIQYKSYGVSLSFTPTVLSDNRINIRVKSEVSALDTTNSLKIDASTNVPNLTTRRAETVLESGSGENSVIAGLLQNTVNSRINGVAGLSELPILGGLFRSNNFTRSDTEIIIIVTPYIVKPIDNRQKIPLPTDGIQFGNGLHRFFDRNIAKTESEIRSQTLENEEKPVGPQLIGEAGFSFEN